MYANVPTRGVAMLLDLLIVGVILVVAAIALDMLVDGSLGYAGYVIVAAYFVMLPLSPLQATLGKRLLGIKVTSLAGSRIGAVRSLVRFAASLVSLATLGLGYAVAFWSGRRRALHDFIAGTIVVESKATSDDVAGYRPLGLSWPLAIAKSAVFLTVFLPLVLLTLFFAIPFGSGLADEINTRNMRETRPVVVALQAYRNQNGRYPPSLNELHPEFLPRLPSLDEHSGLYYAAPPGGERCWLAIVYWRLPGTFLPSDTVNEYDCASRKWQVQDYGTMTAKYEYGFGKR